MSDNKHNICFIIKKFIFPGSFAKMQSIEEPCVKTDRKTYNRVAFMGHPKETRSIMNFTFNSLYIDEPNSAKNAANLKKSGIALLDRNDSFGYIDGDSKGVKEECKTSSSNYQTWFAYMRDKIRNGAGPGRTAPHKIVPSVKMVASPMSRFKQAIVNYNVASSSPLKPLFKSDGQRVYRVCLIVLLLVL